MVTEYLEYDYYDWGTEFLIVCKFNYLNLNTHLWLVATISDCTGLDPVPLNTTPP